MKKVQVAPISINFDKSLDINEIKIYKNIPIFKNTGSAAYIFLSNVFSVLKGQATSSKIGECEWIIFNFNLKEYSFRVELFGYSINEIPKIDEKKENETCNNIISFIFKEIARSHPNNAFLFIDFIADAYNKRNKDYINLGKEAKKLLEMVKLIGEV